MPQLLWWHGGSPCLHHHHHPPPTHHARTRGHAPCRPAPHPHARVGAHALVLTANNTGILAPVVLEAAIGPGSGPIGMLATIPLYFMQLPGSVLLFELQRRGRARGSGGGRGRGRAELEGGQQRQWQRHEGGGSDDDDGGADGEDWPLTADGGEEGAKGHSSIGGSGGRGLGGNGGRIAEEVPLLRQLFSSNLVFSTAAAALTSLAGLQVRGGGE